MSEENMWWDGFDPNKTSEAGREFLADLRSNVPKASALQEAYERSCKAADAALEVAQHAAIATQNADFTESARLYEALFQMAYYQSRGARRMIGDTSDPELPE